MKIRRQHLIIGGIILLAITFLTIGVLYQSPPQKYYAHSLRHWQEADSVAGYPILVAGSREEGTAEFITTEFQPNLSTMSPMEQFLLPTARGFTRPPKNEARAASTGIVLYTGDPEGYPGKAVLLGHRLPNGEIVQSLYAGLSKIKVLVGKHVPRGTLLGTGSGFFEIRQGVAIDIAREEVANVVLNSDNEQDKAPAPNRLELEGFFKKHGLASPSELDPLTLIQQDELREARQQLGLDHDL